MFPKPVLVLFIVRTAKSNGDINPFGSAQLFGEVRIKRERGGGIYSLSKLSRCVALVQHTPKARSRPECNFLLPILPTSMLQNHCIVLSSNPGFQKYLLINLKK